MDYLLVYVISPAKYKEHLKKGKYKYLFLLFTPSHMIKMLENIYVEDEIKGKVIGINLKAIDYQDDEQLQKFISYINKSKAEDSKNIYIEDMEGISVDIKRKIEMGTDLIFPNELELKLYNMKLILKELMEKKNFIMKEVLIISKNKDILLHIINLLHEVSPFISIIPDKEDGENICEEILNNIGLSVFEIKDIGNSLKRYDIIINMEKNLEVSSKDVKKDAILFDFSDNQRFRNIKQCTLIEDIAITKDNHIKASLLSKHLTSSLYENLTGKDNISFNSIYNRDEFYSLDEIIKDDESLKGNL